MNNDQHNPQDIGGQQNNQNIQNEPQNVGSQQQLGPQSAQFSTTQPPDSLGGVQPEQQNLTQAVNNSDQQPKSTNGFAIAGIILAFFLPLLGLIFSVISLVQIKKRNQSGKGLAIAGLVISVIGLLIQSLIISLLVITTSSGVELRSADQERQDDITAIHNSLELQYTANDSYPSLKQINDPAWRANNMPGVTDEIYMDPDGNSTEFIEGIEFGVYSYTPSSANFSECDNENIVCERYVLTTSLELGGGTFQKLSLN